jgi:hypothetical protein
LKDELEGVGALISAYGQSGIINRVRKGREESRLSGKLHPMKFINFLDCRKKRSWAFEDIELSKKKFARNDEDRERKKRNEKRHTFFMGGHRGRFLKTLN